MLFSKANSYFDIADPTTARSAFRDVQTEQGVIILNREVKTAASSSTVAPGTLTGTVTTMANLPADESVAEGAIYFVTNTGEDNDDLYVRMDWYCMVRDH